MDVAGAVTSMQVSLCGDVHFWCSCLSLSLQLISSTNIMCELLRNAACWALPRIYWIRMGVLQRSSPHSDAHWSLTIVMLPYSDFTTSRWGSQLWASGLKSTADAWCDPSQCVHLRVKRLSEERWPRLYSLAFPSSSHQCTTHILRRKSIKNVFPLKCLPLTLPQHTHTHTTVINF